jgi:hypothetical protein
VPRISVRVSVRSPPWPDLLKSTGSAAMLEPYDVLPLDGTEASAGRGGGRGLSSRIGMFRVERLGVACPRSDRAIELARLLPARVLLLPVIFPAVCS